MILRSFIFILCSWLMCSCHNSEHLERENLSLMQANTLRNWCMSETLYALVPGSFASLPAVNGSVATKHKGTGSAGVPLDSSRGKNLLPVAVRHTQYSESSQTESRENNQLVVDEERNKDLEVNEFTFIPFVVLGSVFLFGFLVIVQIVRIYKEPY